MNKFDENSAEQKSRKVSDLVKYFDTISDELQAGKSSLHSNKFTRGVVQGNRDNKSKPNKIDKIVEELLKTEETYFQTLRHIIGNYVFYFKQEIDENIFKHVEDLGKLQLIFYVDLIESKDDTEKIAQCFLKHKLLFHQYKVYISDMFGLFDILSSRYNKLVEERRKQLGDNFRLSDHLLTPFQRLTRYIMLLKNLLKQRETGCNRILKEAISYLESIAEELNLNV